MPTLKIKWNKYYMCSHSINFIFYKCKLFLELTSSIEAALKRWMASQWAASTLAQSSLWNYFHTSSITLTLKEWLTCDSHSLLKIPSNKKSETNNFNLKQVKRWYHRWPQKKISILSWYTACVTPQLLTQKLNSHTTAIKWHTTRKHRKSPANSMWSIRRAYKEKCSMSPSFKIFSLTLFCTIHKSSNFGDFE